MFIKITKLVTIKSFFVGLLGALLIEGYGTALFAKGDSIFVNIIGDTVQVWNTSVIANCASVFSSEITFVGESNIVITERDTIGPIANCICCYDFCISLIGLSSGRYAISIHREELKQYYYPKDTTMLIGEFIFTLQNSSSLPFAWTFHQSECLPLTEAELTNLVPKEFLLEQNYPNPFNNSTEITFQLPQTEEIDLTIYNIRGEVVKRLIKDKIESIGNHTITWDGRNENGEEVSSGVFFYVLDGIRYRKVKKMMLIK